MVDRTQETLFQLPTDPDEFGVLLAPPELIKIDFSALEFETARRAVIEYIKTYYPNEFNDFVSNNGIIMLAEIVSYVTANMGLRSDILANEGTLPTCQTAEAVVNHLALINQKIRRATPATADISCSVGFQISTDVNIPAGTKIRTTGEDGNAVVYEIYRAPDDFISPITIPASKKGVVAYGIEGETQTSIVISAGGADQQAVIYSNNILEFPIIVNITTTSSAVSGASVTITDEWKQIDILETANANDKVYETRFYDDRIVIIFGDDVHGAAPGIGDDITVTYRVGGGLRGRVASGVLSTSVTVIPDPPFNIPTSVALRNDSPSVGGTDKETLAAAKKRAPREFATHGTAITASDYSQLASTFSHPTFGTVSKAVATVRTGLNTNRVELYVLAEGAGNIPVLPTDGLKAAVASYFDEINPITDEVVALNGAIKYVSVVMNVIMDKNADAPSVKLKVDTAVDNFFAISNWDMGKPFFYSQLVNVVNDIDGVEYIDLFSPPDNILATNELADPTVSGIGLNEVIALGDKQITYYFNN